jgi:hypothetical protein
MNLYFLSGPGAAIKYVGGSIKMDIRVSEKSQNVNFNFWSHEFIFNESGFESRSHRWDTNYTHVDKLQIESSCQNQTFLIEGLRQKELTILVRGSYTKVVLRNNDIDNITIIDQGCENLFDFTQQILKHTHMDFNSSTRYVYPTITAPICFCCTDSVATKVFQPCGHWGVCTECAKNTVAKCPICRQNCHTASLFVVSS